MLTVSTGFDWIRGGSSHNYCLHLCHPRIFLHPLYTHTHTTPSHPITASLPPYNAHLRHCMSVLPWQLMANALPPFYPATAITVPADAGRLLDVITSLRKQGYFYCGAPIYQPLHIFMGTIFNAVCQEIFDTLSLSLFFTLSPLF